MDVWFWASGVRICLLVIRHPDPLLTRTTGFRHVTAQLYCNKMTFLFDAAATG